LVAVGAPNVYGGIPGAVYIYSCSSASSCTETLELTAKNGASFNNFGSALALSGSALVVGSFGTWVTPGGQQGAAFVYSCSNAYSCELVSELTCKNSTLAYYFGKSVGVSGSTVVVGAYGKPYENPYNQEGAAYVYSCPSGSPCTLASELTAKTKTNPQGDEFGYSVAISGSWLVAGVPGSKDEIGTTDIFYRI